MKKILANLLVLLILVFVGGCTTELTSTIKLESPTINLVQNNVVYWNSINNADSYIICIDNLYEQRTTELSFNLDNILTESKTISIKVKATGDGINYGDSNWSNILDYQFIKEDNNDILVKNKLNTPTLITYLNNQIIWNSVENASGYCVKINGDEKNVYATYCRVTFAYSCEFTFQIKAIANKNDMNYVDSDWSTEQLFQFSNNDINASDYEDYLNYELGFGINIITAEYLDSKSITNSTFLDINKLAKMYDLHPTNVSDTKFTTIQEESFQNFSLSLAKKYTLGSSVNIGINAGQYGFGGTLTNDITLSSNFKISAKTKQYYNFGYQNIYDKEMAILNFNKNEIKNKEIISSFAIAELNEIINEENEEQRNQMIIKFFDIFGTHIITDALYGGKIEVLYYLITNDTSINFELTNDYNSSLNLNGKSDLLQAEIELINQISNGLKIGTMNSETLSEFKARFIGGGAIGMAGTNDIVQFYKNCDDWIDEYNMLASKNTMVGLVDGGLVPIWELLPSKYDELSDIMKQVFNEKLDQVNNEFIRKFSYEKDLTKEFSGGTGSKNNPYLIENEYQLELINQFLNQEVYFKLIKDIIIEKNWTPIGTYSWSKGVYPEKYFSGYFDGNNHTITYYINIQRVTKDELNKFYSYGLFGSVKNASFENLKVNATIKTIDYETNKTWDISNEYSPNNILAGSIAGWANNTEVNNCNVNSCISLLYEGNKSTGCTRVGGILGYSETTKIYNCVVLGDYKASGFNAACGGLVGTIYNTTFENINVMNVKTYATKGKWIFGTCNNRSTYGSKDKIK